MSSKLTVCGIPCSYIVRGYTNGGYRAVFSCTESPLSAVEKIDWSRPVVEGDCLLPAGYGFTVKSITYEPAFEAISVELEVAAQYLGDVTGYAAQVAELEDQLAGKTTAVQALEEQLAEADEALIALYEAQSQTQDTTHQETEDGVQEVSV